MRPPGPFLQTINSWLHREPVASLAHAMFWGSFFIVICPIVGFILVLVVLPWRLLFQNRAKVVPISEKRELAVCITGCDSGFGKDVALALAKKGYTVFAGCLHCKDGIVQFEGHKNIIPIQMDVTKINEIEEAVENIRLWINSASRSCRRVLHAVVNNAGIGNGQLVDWMESLSANSQKEMDVNFFGLVNTIKEHLPILKSQKLSGVYKNSRIINVVSMAGLVGGFPGMSMYHASKFAAEAFTMSLRTELAPFGIYVVSVNPSFHKTPLVDYMPSGLDKLWKGLSPELKEEYGKDYFDVLRGYVLQQSHHLMWESSVAVDELLRCVELIEPPCQCIVGSDAKFALLLIRMVPVWLNHYVQDIYSGFHAVKLKGMVSKSQ